MLSGHSLAPYLLSWFGTENGNRNCFLDSNSVFGTKQGKYTPL